MVKIDFHVMRLELSWGCDKDILSVVCWCFLTQASFTTSIDSTGVQLWLTVTVQLYSKAAGTPAMVVARRVVQINIKMP